MGTRRGTPEHFAAAAKRANKREERKAPLFAWAGMVPVHTAEEQKVKAEAHQAHAEQAEKERLQRGKDLALAAAKELAKIVSGEQFRTLTAYARHCFPADIVPSVIRRTRLEIEQGRIPWALTDDSWKQPRQNVHIREFPNGAKVPVLILTHINGTVEDLGPLRDPYAPKPTLEDIAETKATMDRFKQEWEAKIPAMRAQVEAWRRGEKVFSWQKCGRAPQTEP